MRTWTKYTVFLTFLPVFMLGCKKDNIIPEDRVHYSYLQNCLWTPVDNSGNSSFTGIGTEPENPFYFTSGAIMLLTENDGEYIPAGSNKYKVDEGSNDMTITVGGTDYRYSIHILCRTHLTLFENGNPDRYATFSRGQMPVLD